MILRRVIEHFKKQEWTAIAIDFVIVVLGVFVGIQVSNWNSDRKDRRDGLVYIDRLHEEVVFVEKISARVRARRLDLISTLTDAARVIFEPAGGGVLTEAQCFSLSVSHFFNIKISGLPSLEELMYAGRLSIIRDPALATALVNYRQQTEQLEFVVATGQPGAHNLQMLNPNAISLSPVFDSALGEMQGAARCDLAAMRGDRAFLNAVAENVDGYDAYLRDGLKPWNDQLIAVHALLDAKLGLSHKNGA